MKVYSVAFALLSGLLLSCVHPPGDRIGTLPSRIDCRRLPPFSPENWPSVAAAFSQAPRVAMDQAWLAQRQENFRSAMVRLGLRDGMLWVFAEMKDESPFNPKTGFNEWFFLHGDTFEIFLRPEGQSAYYEFHIGPTNQLFLLRIPSLEELESGGSAEQWKLKEALIKSWSAVDPQRGVWRVLAAIPIDSIVEPGGSRDEWLFSFARYDYTLGEETPVISSTSPHAVPFFHRQHEWGKLVFTER